MFERGLVKTNIKGKDIVKQSDNYSDVEREVKQFTGTTLTYVTPVCDKDN